MASMINTPIPAGAAGPTVITPNAGSIYYGVIVSTSAAGIPLIYDNATTNSGNIIGEAPASTVGQILAPSGGIYCRNGITVAGGATMPAMTILWG